MDEPERPAPPLPKVGKIHKKQGRIRTNVSPHLSIEDLIVFLQSLTHAPGYTSHAHYRRHFSFRNLSDDKDKLFGQFHYSEKDSSTSFFIKKEKDSDTLEASCPDGNANTFQLMIDILIKLIEKLGQKRELTLSGSEDVIKLMTHICNNYSPPIAHKKSKDNTQPLKKTSPPKPNENPPKKNKSRPEHSRLIFNTDTASTRTLKK